MDIDKNVHVHQKIDTTLNADSIEFCPYVEKQNLLLCGTYKLQETETVSTTSPHLQPGQPTDDVTIGENNSPPVAQTRLGGVVVYSLESQDGKPHLSEVGRIDMCGVLDIKWPGLPIGGRNLFGFVDAEGFFQIFELPGVECQPSLVAKEILSDSSLGLSLGWDGGVDRLCSKAVASDSKGFINAFHFGDGALLKVSQWHAHDFEAWITAFHDFDSNIVYSGGDDCTLKGWDLRDTSKPTFTSRRHTMGVCSIQSHPFDEHLYATGSYDEELLIWDRRQQKRPLADTNLGGGVWRIKWDPFCGQFILTATMYNGTHIVNCQNLDSSPLPIETQHSDHNLAYGADWCRLDRDLVSVGVAVAGGGGDRGSSQDKESSGRKKRPYLVSTCSFYDHALHLWQWTPGPVGV